MLRSLTFFHTTEDGVSAVIYDINVDQLSFFAVKTVCRKTAPVFCRPPTILCHHGYAYNKSELGSYNTEPESKRGPPSLAERRLHIAG